jgi:hypothetical protein
MKLPKDDRVIVTGLFGLAFTVRLVSLVVLHRLAAPRGGPFLGLDSTAFLERSQALALSSFVVPDHPIAVFRDMGVAHYYLFAAAIRWLGADLFGLQLLNGTLIALVAPLTYLWCRRIAPAAARPAGVIVALHPSLVTLGALDLLKDPSIVFFTSLAIWALVRTVDGSGARRTVCFTLVASVALIYLRLDRFYIAAYVEFAALVAMLYVLVRGARPGRPWLAAAALVGAVLIAEVVPVRLGWPSSVTFMTRAIGWAIDVPRLREYAPGLIDDLVPDDATPAPEGAGPPLGRNDAPSRAGGGVTVVAASFDRAVRVPQPATPSQPGAAPTPVRVLRALESFPAPIPQLFTGSVNLVRRLYGPFVWIVPERWDLRTILTNDYPMYPGMLLWYAFMPMIAIGLARTGWRLATLERFDFGTILVWLFSCMFLGQYLLTNLAYRHRETMVPCLFVFGLIGWPAGWTRNGKIAYGIYWSSIVLVAIAHLWLRFAIGAR